MRQNNRLRWIIVLSLIVVSGYYLYPTLKFYSLSTEVKNDPALEQEMAELESESLKLGLDLQGGIHMQMEIELPSLVKNLASNRDEVFDQIVDEAEALSNENKQDFLENLDFVAQSRNIRLERYFDRERRVDENGNELEVMNYLQIQADDGIRQALNILRNRINQFGVSEPNIHKQGDRRIIVELPGLDNINRAKALIGQTAKLEFRLEKDPNVLTEVFEALDKALKNEPQVTASTDTAITESETTPLTETDLSLAKLLGDTTSQAQAETAPVDLGFGDHPFQELLTNVNNLVTCSETNRPKVEAILQRDDIKKLIPGDAEFLWDAEAINFNDQKYYELYLLKKDMELGGEVITDAKVTIGSGYDPSTAGQALVLMTMNREGRRTWSRVTGANIDKRIAIVLDGVVLTAPNVISKIPDGRSQITGNFTMESAKDLAINLRSGSFKADMKIISEQTIGPSLGQDSISKGAYSATIGFILVLIFMIVYYRFSGTIATLALFLNLFFVMAVLAGFHATLTLPGIAGLILTIGMAVDANVLIFERIREELLTGKTVRAAIDSGYSRAFWTILDANITTLITAVILYQYGTGPIKGFALTLSIGIIASMFTAIIVTRLVFNFYTSKITVTELSI